MEEKNEYGETYFSSGDNATRKVGYLRFFHFSATGFPFGFRGEKFRKKSAYARFLRLKTDIPTS